MDHRTEQLRWRNEELREELAIRKQERALVREERQMERKLNDLADAEEHVERQIEQEWRRERGGREPEHLPIWPSCRDRR